jgi:hypothetical protein
MTGLYIVVADSDGIVSHIGNYAGEKMLALGIDIVVIVGGIVPLETVAGIDKQYVILAVGSAYAVHIAVDGHKAELGPATYIGRVEPASVDVVGSQEMKGMDAVLRAAGCQEKHQREEKELSHISVIAGQI